MPTTQFDPGFVFKYGSRESVNTLAYEGGAIIFCSNGEHFVDTLGTRHRISDIIADYTQKQLESVGRQDTTPAKPVNPSNTDSGDDSESSEGDSESDEPITPISPSTKFYGPPFIYIARDTKHMYLYNRTTKVMDRLTVILAEAATNDSDGNNIVNTYETKVESTSNFTEASQRLDELESSVAALPTFIVRVIDNGALPVTGEPGVLYFLPIRGTGEDTVYDTYIWAVGDAGKYYLKVGTSAVDLEAYTTLDKLSSSLAELKTQIDNEIAELKKNLEAADSALDKRLTAAELNINDLKTVDTAYGKRIIDVEAKANTNASDIDTLKKSLSDDEADIDDLQELTKTHSSDIATLKKDVSDNQTHSSGSIANKDFNSYTAAATYHVTDNTSSTNNPTTDAGILYVAAFDGNVCQMYFTPTEFYRRYYNGSSWGGWRLVQEYAVSDTNVDDYGFEG